MLLTITPVLVYDLFQERSWAEPPDIAWDARRGFLVLEFK